MNFLKHSGNSSYQDQLAEFLHKSYVLRGGATAFITQQTSLFQTHDGKPFKPYDKQIHFMNCLKPTDRLVLILKCRQCLTGDTVINTEYGKKTIKELYESNYRGKVETFNKKGKLVYDNVLDIWNSGLKKIYEIKSVFSKKIIRGSENHKIFTKRGWKKISELTMKDNIAVKYNDTYESNMWDSIESIVDTGISEETYDMTTEKYHSYIANGIHVHNSGFSTSIVARAVYEAYFNKVPEIIIVSVTRTSAEKVLDRIKKAFRSMNEALRPEFVTENKQQLELKNGVKIYSLSSNPDGMHGFTGIAYCDEFAMLSDNDSAEVFTALYPSTTTGGRIVLISTPKGQRGKFHELATKSLKEISGRDVKFEKVQYVVHWRDVPFIKYAVEELGLFDALTADEIEQEYGLSFLADTVESYFSLDFLMDKFVEKEDDIPLYTSYEDMGIPNEFVTNLDIPLPESFSLNNNKSLLSLPQKYSSFKAGWDVASKNDDSIFAVVGSRIDDNSREDVIAEFTLNSISDNVQTQAKYTKRIVQALNLSQVTVDIKGLGQSAKDFYDNDELLSEVINPFTYTNQTKVDGMSRLKNRITTNKLKRRYDGSKDDNNKIKQFTNLYYANGKIIGKGGKDDYGNAIMLATEENQVGYAGFHFL